MLLAPHLNIPTLLPLLTSSCTAPREHYMPVLRQDPFQTQVHTRASSVGVSSPVRYGEPSSCPLPLLKGSPVSRSPVAGPPVLGALGYAQPGPPGPASILLVGVAPRGVLRLYAGEPTLPTPPAPGRCPRMLLSLKASLSLRMGSGPSYSRCCVWRHIFLSTPHIFNSEVDSPDRLFPSYPL